MHGNILRLRGYSSTRTCPRCGSETMRVVDRGGLDSLLRVLHLRRRWCRRCLRQWIAPRNPAGAGPS
jgi:hypothetical protein